MMKNAVSILMIASFGLHAWGQGTATTAVVQPQPAQAVTNQEVVVISPSNAQNTVTQPTTVVEAQPLVQSRAEQIRQAREQAEIQTEQKIVEKLESSRLEDEQKRMDRIFGDKLDKKEEVKEEPVVVQPVAPVVPVQPQQKSDEQLKAEITEAIKADLAKEEVKKEEPKKTRMSVGALIGKVSYDGVNISDDMGGGVEVGWQLDDSQFSIDLGFVYSRHLVDDVGNPYFSYDEMDQYNWMAGVRYAILPYRVTPVVGALGSYTRRVYTKPYSNFSNNESESDAIDVGLLIGVELTATKNLNVSFDYRRMVNVDADYDNDVYNRPGFSGYSNNGLQPIEEMDYDLVSVSAKFLF